jgi:hypothetical protein
MKLLILLGFLGIFSTLVSDSPSAEKNIGKIISFDALDDFKKKFEISLYITDSQKNPIKCPKDLQEGSISKSDAIETQEARVETEQKDCQFFVTIGDRSMEVLASSILFEGNILTFEIKGNESLSREKDQMLVIQREQEVISRTILGTQKEIESRPSIEKIYPNAAGEGSVVTILGKNFGENPEKLLILIESYKDYKKPRTAWVSPDFVSPLDNEGNQTIKFTLPFGLALSKTKDLITPVQLKVRRNFLESHYENPNLSFQILHPKWKLLLMGASFLCVNLLYLIVGFFKKKLFWTRSIFLDNRTNRYSLAKFEILTWSGIIILGFFYTIFYFSLFNRMYSVDWNISLLSLILVIYLPLFISRAIDKRFPKNEIKALPPHLSDLWFTKGALDITRFQMFGFSLVTKFLVLYLLFHTDLFEAPLIIPSHFLGFMIVSRIFYIAGKLLKEKISIQVVTPHSWKAGETNIVIRLQGQGFEKGQKIQIGNTSPQLLQVESETQAQVIWKRPLPPGIHAIFIYSPESVLGSTVPYIHILQNKPVEPNPPSPLSVASKSSAKKKSA